MDTKDALAGFQTEEGLGKRDGRKGMEEEEEASRIPESQPVFLRAKICNGPTIPFDNPYSNTIGFKLPSDELKRRSDPSFQQNPSKNNNPFDNGIDSERSSGPTIEQHSRKGNWLVRDDSLKCLPIGFPLERTSRVIADPASVVSNRVSDCLRLRSIQAKFNNKKAIAKCHTLDQVCLHIRLFAPRNEDGTGTLIEVQRRRGDAISFLKECRIILNAAEGDGVDAFPETVPIPIKLDMECVIGGDIIMKKESEENILAEAIESAVELITKEELDLNVMAFESLIALVDPLKTIPDVALKACKTIVAHDSKDTSASEIRGAIVALLRNGSLRDVDKDDIIISDFNVTLKNLSLCLLSKTFENMLNEGCLETAIQENKKWFVHAIIPPLVNAVKGAKERPHDALYATQCLSNLLRASKVFLQRADKEDALCALQEAKTFGSTNHLSLANATEKGITILKNHC